jgi:hypothetical protein
MYFFTINWFSFRWPFVAGLGTCGYIFLKIGLSVTGKQTLIPIDFQLTSNAFTIISSMDPLFRELPWNMHMTHQIAEGLLCSAQMRM